MVPAPRNKVRGGLFGLEPDDFSSNRHPALTYSRRMIFFRKPVSTFRDRALAAGELRDEQGLLDGGIERADQLAGAAVTAERRGAKAAAGQLPKALLRHRDGLRVGCMEVGTGGAEVVHHDLNALGRSRDVAALCNGRHADVLSCSRMPMAGVNRGRRLSCSNVNAYSETLRRLEGTRLATR